MEDDADEALIAKASSGRTLCGTYVGGSDELIGSKQAKKELLCPPKACKLKKPDRPYKMESLCLSSIQAYEDFSDAVRKSGLSVACNISTANIFSLGATVAGGIDKSKLEEMKATCARKTSEACYLQYWYIPKATFSLSPNQMQLTAEALDDMYRINTTEQAKQFLDKYNSHISTGLFYLGGILFKGVTMKSNSETTFQSMLEKVVTKSNLKVEVSYLVAKGGVEFVNLNDGSSSSSNTSSKKQAIVKTVSMALGPSTDDEEEFKKGLEDSSTWYIIDTEDGGELVPVWDIPSVKGVSGLHSARNLLKESWQYTIESICPSKGRLYEMLQESYSSSQRLNSSLSTPEDRTLNVNMLLRSCLNEKMKTPVETYQILSDLWFEASKKTDSEISASWDERVRLFQDSIFLNLLSGIAESAEKDLSDAKTLIVQGILSTDMQKVLKNANINLPTSIRNLIDQAEVVDRLPTLPSTLSPTQLLVQLRELQSEASNFKMPDNLVEASIKAIKACLREHSIRSEAVKSIVMKHGFNERGNFSGRSFEDDTLQIIIHDLNDHLETRPPPYLGPREPDIFDITSDTVPEYSTSLMDKFTYSGDFLVDRPNTSSCEDPCRRMMDHIRHRIEPFKARLDTFQDSSEILDQDYDDDYDDDITFGSDSSSCTNVVPDDGTVTSNHSLECSPLEILVQLLVRSDVLAQVSILQVLLEERFAIPIVVPLEKVVSPIEGSTEFGHLVEALGFVKVKLENQEILSIAEDTKLLRVVFVSNRKVVSQRQITEMACDVMNCQFPNYGFDFHRNVGSHDHPTVVELGVGFVLNMTGAIFNKDVVPNEKPPKQFPCLVFCVSGDHNQLGTLLEKIADVVVMETEPGAIQSGPSWTTARQNIFSWSTDSIRPFGQTRQRSKPNFRQVWGSFKQVSQAISRFLNSAWSKQLNGHNSRATTLEECFKSVASLNRKTSISNVVVELEISDFENARIDFLLQKIYTEEAQYYFEALQNPRQRLQLQRKIKDCQERRAREAKRISKLPILQHFVKLLLESDHVKRNIGIWQFQLTIDKKLHLMLEKAARKENDAFDDYQRNPGSKDLKGKYYRAKEEHVDKMLGLEHLWRELSHIFVADPEHRRLLPKLATLHLIDGFPLEILDGDAGTFHQPWVDSVLVELDRALQVILKRKPKVFVLSVVGLQSSGKSTLLNVMFGAKLKASAGMCTRGVFLQLVKSEWPGSHFDYVLILDTMGLKAPEYFGRKGAVAHDNRLATFAVLPADACVVMVANEEDNGLKEVLPMVMLAFKGSALAERESGRIKAKLFFVYRSVDKNDIKKLKNNQRKLIVDLQEASRAVGNLSISGGSCQISALPDGVSPLQDFQNNPEDEKKSDVKYFGNLKKDTTPPDDVPIWEYGSKVEELREYIHERVLSGGSRWTAHELVKWKDYLGMVWKSIDDANFELSFVNQIEHANYHEIQTRLATCRQKVGKKWQDEFESLTSTKGLDAAQTDQPFSFIILWKDLEIKIEDTVKNVDQEVREIFDDERYQNWKVAETDGWHSFLKSNRSHWQEQLQNWTDVVLGFESSMRKYTSMMEVEMSSVRKKSYNLDSDEKIMKKDFESIFQRVLEDAADKHPAMATKVEGIIHKKYVNDSVVGGKYKFEAGTEDKIRFIDMLKTWTTESIKYTTSYILSQRETYNPGEVLRHKLMTRLQASLEDVQEYSDHLVDNMMQFTEKSIQEERKCSKALGQEMHNLVKISMTERMTKIQEDWDKQHNVSKKLEEQRGYFWTCFMNHAKKLNGTKMLAMAFCNALGKDHLVSGFTGLLSRNVVNELQSEQWVTNWKVMRAYLDLHLIELIESKKSHAMIHYVSNGKGHYKCIVNKLIESAITNRLKKADLWTLLTGAITDAMNTAAVAAGRSRSDLEKTQVYQENIISSLASLSPELAKSVSIKVSMDVCQLSGSAINFYDIRDQVSKMINGIHFDTASFTTADTVDKVRNRMVESNTDGARPRCDETCPRCGLTCFVASNHPGKHHTLHQPEGLWGVSDKHSHELCWHSCSKSVELNLYMKGNGLPDFVPYKDFEKYFPSWTLPSDGLGEVEVREYIFAHFQKELVEVYHEYGCRACTDIPLEFRHDLKSLRIKLENVILSCTGRPYNPSDVMTED